MIHQNGFVKNIDNSNKDEKFLSIQIIHLVGHIYNFYIPCVTFIDEVISLQQFHYFSSLLQNGNINFMVYSVCAQIYLRIVDVGKEMCVMEIISGN